MVARVGDVGAGQLTQTSLDELLGDPLSTLQASSVAVPRRVDPERLGVDIGTPGLPSPGAPAVEPFSLPQPVSPNIGQTVPGFGILADPGNAQINPLESDAGIALVKAIKGVLDG